MRTALSKLSGWDRRRTAVERYRTNHWIQRSMDWPWPLVRVNEDSVFVLGFKMFDPFAYVDDERFGINNNAMVMWYHRLNKTAKIIRSKR